MSEATPPRLSKAALVAFLLGLSSFSPLSIVTALPALCLGVQAIRAINRSDGQLRGQRLAIAGLLLGAVVTLVTVIGTAALLLLFVQEKNHVAGCTNNLRQIGQSIQRYSDHNDHVFPPGTVPNPSLKPEQRLSWEAAVLPFLSAGGPAGKKWEKLAGEIAFKEAWDAPANAKLRQNVAPYLCPVFAHTFAQGQAGLTSYVGVAGMGRAAAALPLRDANAGFFGYDRLLQPSDITASLGATMVTIETTRENGPWPAGGPATVRGLEPDCDRYIGKAAAFGGLHREGANVLWADGSVRIVTEQIEPDLFRLEARIAR
jgi:prepilin-type processing-associated H-X9-DG protein